MTTSPDVCRSLFDSVVQHHVYHGTNRRFKTFSETSDIGYHFGDKAAAIARMKRLGQADVDIKEIGPTQLERDCFAVFSRQNEFCPTEKLFSLLLRKLAQPHGRIRQVIDDMNEGEVLSLIKEYENQPDSPFFLDRVRNGGMPSGFAVTVNDEIIESVSTEAEAKVIAARIDREMKRPVRAHVMLTNPIDLPDLGIWPAFEIAETAKFSKKELEQVANAPDEQFMYAAVRRILASKGFDGIRYVNLVENPGSISYIVFNSNQIILD